MPQLAPKQRVVSSETVVTSLHVPIKHDMITPNRVNKGYHAHPGSIMFPGFSASASGLSN